jgi:hypothetical protein
MQGLFRHNLLVTEQTIFVSVGDVIDDVICDVIGDATNDVIGDTQHSI